MKTAKRFRETLEALRTEILDNIKDIVTRQKGEYLEIEDNRGSLVIGGDEQESIIIGSLETRGNSITANWGVYSDEDSYTHIEEYDIELLINILDACEKAEEEIEQEKE